MNTPSKQLKIIPLLLISLLFLLFLNACATRYHVVYQQNPQVIDVNTQTKCEVEYFSFTEWEVRDVYGPPCSVMLTRKVGPIPR